MPHYSITIATTREVVLKAKTLADAHKAAMRYAKDCFPTTSPPVIVTSTECPKDHTSRTSDDADHIPRDS